MLEIGSVLVPILNGLSNGLALALAAVGLTLVFGVMHVVNLAHAEFYMVGAYLTLFLMGVLGNYWLALLIGAILTAIVALPVERLTLAPIRERDPIQSMIITFALLFVFHQLAFEVFGGHTRSLPMPVEGSINLGLLSYPANRLLIIVAAPIVLLLVWFFLEKTRYGLLIRASAQDIENARSLGVPVSKVYSITFALSAFLAAIAAGFLAPLRGVYPTMGLSVLLDIFIITIIGGLGSIPGAIIAALFIGFSRSISSIWIAPWVAEVVVLAAVILVLLVRPEGIFGE